MILTSDEKDYSRGCETDFTDYSLTARNLNGKVDRLGITCGARRTDYDEEWFAPYSVRLILGEMKLLAYLMKVTLIF